MQHRPMRRPGVNGGPRAPLTMPEVILGGIIAAVIISCTWAAIVMWKH
jgi:hypothetical protein